MKAQTSASTSSLPPAVAALGTPEAIHGLDTTWEYLMWFCVLGLAFIALICGLAAARPFGVHPPPPAVELIGLLVCGAAALGFFTSLMKIRGHYYLLFASCLVVMDYERYVIIPWETITQLRMLGSSGQNRFSVQTRDGQKYVLESYVQDVAGLATAIRERVERGRGNVGGASTFQASLPTAAALKAKPNNAFWPTVDDLAGARTAAMQGVGTSLFCCFATAGVVIINAVSNLHLLNLGPSALIDAFFFAVIAFGIYRMSRVAAICGLGLYLVERVVEMAAVANSPGSGNIGGVSFMTIILTMMYVNAIRGTFAYHGLREIGAVTGAISGSQIPPIANPESPPYVVAAPVSGYAAPSAAGATQATPVPQPEIASVPTEPPAKTGLQPRVIDDLAPEREWKPDWSGFAPSAHEEIAPPSPEARWADPSFPGVRTGSWSPGAAPLRPTGPQTPGASAPPDHASYLEQTGYTGKRYASSQSNSAAGPTRNPATVIATIVGVVLLVSVLGSLFLRLTLGAFLSSRFHQVQQAIQSGNPGQGIAPFGQFTPMAFPTMQPWPTAQPWPTDSNGNPVLQPTMAPFPDNSNQNPNGNP